jgi:hypothetical protein
MQQRNQHTHPPYTKSRPSKTTQKLTWKIGYLAYSTHRRCCAPTNKTTSPIRKPTPSLRNNCHSKTTTTECHPNHVTQPNRTTYLQRVSGLRGTDLRCVLQQSLKTCTKLHNIRSATPHRWTPTRAAHVPLVETPDTKKHPKTTKHEETITFKMQIGKACRDCQAPHLGLLLQ